MIDGKNGNGNGGEKKSPELPKLPKLRFKLYLGDIVLAEIGAMELADALAGGLRELLPLVRAIVTGGTPLPGMRRPPTVRRPGGPADPKATAHKNLGWCDDPECPACLFRALHEDFPGVDFHLRRERRE